MIDKRLQAADFDEPENSMHPAKRVNAIQQLNDRLKDIEGKVDDITAALNNGDHCRYDSEEREDVLGEINTKWNDVEDELSTKQRVMETELDLAFSMISEGTGKMKTAFQKVRDRFEAKIFELVSNTVHDNAKDIFIDGLKDGLKNVLKDDNMKGLLEQAIKDQMETYLEKMVVDTVKARMSVMEGDIERRIKKSLMKGIACGLNIEGE